MKAIAVYAGKPNSMHLEDVPTPTVTTIEGGRGVLVKVLRVGVDGTDREITEGKYGQAPDGDAFLITGHENFGQVVEVGPQVPSRIKPGTYVVATVRRPGQSIYDQIGRQDLTTDEKYFERGINLLHGYLAEYYAEDSNYVVPLPETLHDVGVLLEPLTVTEKGVSQAFEIQRRLGVWNPRRAAVIGAGSIGLLATLLLRLRGLEVTCYSRRTAPYLNSDLIEAVGGRYISSHDQSLAQVSERDGPFDLIFEATGNGSLVFEAADILGKNGVLVLAGLSGSDSTAPVAADRINRGFVLGNKVMVGTVNASQADFERGVSDLVQAEAFFPGWLSQLLTTPVRGLERFEEILQHLENKDAIKVFVEVLGE